MKNSALAAAAFAAALGVAPALAAQTTTGKANPAATPSPPAANTAAQSTTGNANAQPAPPAATPAAATPSPAATTKPERGTATITPTGIPPSQRNPLLADNGDVRIGKTVGTDIFNKDDKNIGTVDDVLVDKDGKLNVVVSANSKLVLVPWDKVQFGDAKLNSDNKVLMPDETQASLKSLPEFHYQNQNKGAASSNTVASSPAPKIGSKK